MTSKKKSRTASFAKRKPLDFLKIHGKTAVDFLSFFAFFLGFFRFFFLPLLFRLILAAVFPAAQNLPQQQEDRRNGQKAGYTQNGCF